MPTRQPGIYVEILIQSDLDLVWQLTQEPDQHHRWDLRFTRIEYLPKVDPAEPQRFLYQTRLGFGLNVTGTGESIADRVPLRGDIISSLKFASADPKSLIRTGAGYWKYVPTPAGLRFFTWYDYEVRGGVLGKLTDRIAFRPLMTWATAWSFDRMRLWAEGVQSPEASMKLFLIHATARLTMAFIWIWQGLIPKLLYRHIDERRMLTQAGLPASLLPWIGIAEILVGALILFGWRIRTVLLANTALMVLITMLVALQSPAYLVAAFNPVTLNVGVAALGLVGWLASANLPSAARCRRVNPGNNT